MKIELVLPILFGAAKAASSPSIVQVHGSGTSNPLRCYGYVLEQMEGQSKIPTRMTYRSTATGDGIKDFIGNVTLPNNDFSSGDIPVSAEDYSLLKDNGIEMIHLPALLGAIGIFHSVPVKGGYSLNMTSCVLARIFKRDIVDWKHPDIEAMNPQLDIPVKTDDYGNIADDQSFPITVARRFLGSSSTYAFTHYLAKSCPSEWPQEWAGSRIDWHEDTKVCQGSSQMVNRIREEPGTIGYVDSGLGFNGALDEVALKVNNVAFRDQRDFFFTSQDAINKGGILPVLDEATVNLPDSADADWSGVDLILGEVEEYVYTWPIVVMTYLYVRKDLPSFIPDPRAQTLLVTFLKNMYDENYVDICEKRYGFTRITGNIRDLALEGIDMLETSPGAPEWQVETGAVLPEGGQGDYVISSRRRRVSSIEQEALIRDFESNEAKILDLEAKVQRLEALLGGGDGGGGGGALDENGIDEEMDELHWLSDESREDKERQLDVAYILSILSLCLWFVMLVFMCVLKMELAASNRATAAIAAETKRKHHKRSTLQNVSAQNKDEADGL